MTEDDLKHLQDVLLESQKELLLKDGRLGPAGFVIMLRDRLDDLLESGWGVEFIDPKACLPSTRDDSVAVLGIDLMMNWKHLYHAVLNVFPETQDELPQLIALGEAIGVDDVYMRTMRAYLNARQLDPSDVIAATMRQICAKADAFACIFYTEAWMRAVDSPKDTIEEARKKIQKDLSRDQRSIEVIISSMETHDFARVITIPIRRRSSKRRGAGKILGFGEPVVDLDTPEDQNKLEGRLVRFLKPRPLPS